MKSILQGMNMAKMVDDDDIRSKIVIREGLKSLIPPLSEEELNQLEENILKEGVRDPLVLWPVDDHFVLVDGHNRFSVCQRHNLQFPFKKVSFKDEEEVHGWMVKNQLGRRNLSKEQQSYLRGLRYLQEKQQGKRIDLTSDQKDPKLEAEQTADRLAEEYNVSPATIKRDAQFAAGIELIGQENPEVKKEILQGKAKLKKQDIQDVGQNKKAVRHRFHADEEKTEQKKEKVLPITIAKIAMNFINSERRPIHELADALAVNPKEDPLTFFLRWKENLSMD